MNLYDCHGGPGTTEPECGACVTCLHRIIEQKDQRIKRLDECVQTAWGIIANVSGGNWHNQSPEWRQAVYRWRDEEFHPATRKAKESKP